jgi:ABC-type glycerol-3-phosphate transport system substrate-binding protein
MLQAGSQMITRTSSGYSANLNFTSGADYYPGSSAVMFYTDFSNPTKNTYSWNRSLPLDQNQFLSGDLALYFGPVSEYDKFLSKNPNLNFSVSMMPQKRTNNYSLTYADLTGLAILRSSSNQIATYNNLTLLASAPVAKAWNEIIYSVPARRDLLSNISNNDQVQALAYRSAMVSATWLDPNGQKTEEYFRDLIESVSTGKFTPTEAVSKTSDQLNLLLVKKQEN